LLGCITDLLTGTHPVNTTTDSFEVSNLRYAAYNHKDRYSTVKHNLWIFYC